MYSTASAKHLLQTLFSFWCSGQCQARVIWFAINEYCLFKQTSIPLDSLPASFEILLLEKWKSEKVKKWELIQNLNLSSVVFVLSTNVWPSVYLVSKLSFLTFVECRVCRLSVSSVGKISQFSVFPEYSKKKQEEHLREETMSEVNLESGELRQQCALLLMRSLEKDNRDPVSYTHLRAHETDS